MFRGRLNVSITGEQLLNKGDLGNYKEYKKTPFLTKLINANRKSDQGVILSAFFIVTILIYLDKN